uniref:Transposase (Putative), gypsy type n=1 Tax=Tanacetum cinerariifolium TaxID=118510 RepID=A0A6L2LSW7_TANCI|nr:hypothetical protein [Tanacetum cinerariifolium]
MDFFAFIKVADPTKVKVVKRERAEGDAKLMDSTIGRVVQLLPIAPACAKSELEANVDKLFDEGGSTKHRDSIVGGSHDADIELVTAAEDVGVVTAERPRRQCKKRPTVTDASVFSSSQETKGDYGTSSGAATGGKSSFVLKELLATNILNVEVGVEAVSTLPLVTSSVSTTPRHEDGNPTDSITGLNLRTIGASERFVLSSYSSHHSSVHASGAEVNFSIRSAVLPLVMTEAMVTSHAVNAPFILVLKTGTKITSPVYASMFHDSGSTKTVKADDAGPSYSAKQDLSMIYEMDYHHFFTEFNVGTARQACLNAKVRMWTECCLSERKRLESECESQADLLKAKDVEIENLKAQLLLKKAKAAEAVRLRVQVSAAEAAEKVRAGEMDALKRKNVVLENERESLNGKITELQSSISAKDLKLKDVNVVASSLKSQNDILVDLIKEFQDAQMNIVNDKVVKMDADLLDMALHLKEKFYPHLLTIISGQRWLLTHGLKLVVVKCLNSPVYLMSLGSAIIRVIKKGMQRGLSAGIDHGKAGRNLEDIIAYNPATKADYNSALQRFCEVDKLPRGRKCGRYYGSTSSEEENNSTQWSALVDVWVPLVDPLSAKNLMGAAGTSDSVPATVATTTALSTTFASTNFVPPITIEYYEIACTDGHEGAQGNGASFLTVEFEKEEIDTTLKRDPPS